MREMKEKEETARISRLVLGVLLVGVGGLLVLQEAGVVRIGPFWRFWPLFLVWGGATRLLTPGGDRRATGVLFLALGCFLQAEELGWLNASLGDLWPVLLVAFGIGMILEGLRPARAAAAPEQAADREVRP
jgi:hypothetical protein